ncbi:MAG TPA: DNA repair exonuclease [Clostridiaceae bacterium]|nr:DNA repair exonuclease [Clostridiaceae bacterium]
MKIIHCSDLHFDSKMESNLPFRKAQERNNELSTTFAKMVSFAVEEGVEIILIAGDIFDAERITSRTADFFLDVVREAPGVQFLLLRGNHDGSRRAFAGRKTPPNLKFFGELWTYYTFGEVVIAGVELNNDNCRSIYDHLQLTPETTNIVVMHGQESTQCGEDNVCLPALRGKHIHYLALGHIHSYKKEKLDTEGEFCYSGCLEGRGFDECGEKGFVLLHLKEHRIETKFIPFARRRLYSIPVDITSLTTVHQIGRAMKQAADGISKDSLIKFTLTGSYTLDTQKDLRFLTQLLNDEFYFVKIDDESQLALEQGSYEHDISLKGEFIRTVLASELADREKDIIINCGIQALSGEEIAL